MNIEGVDSFERSVETEIKDSLNDRHVNMSILNENDSKSLNKDRKNGAEIQDENSGFIQIEKKDERVESFERFVISKIVK